MKPTTRKALFLVVFGAVILAVGLFFKGPPTQEVDRQNGVAQSAQPQNSVQQAGGEKKPLDPSTERNPAAAPTPVTTSGVSRTGGGGGLNRDKESVLQYFKSNWPGEWKVQTQPSGEIMSVLGGVIPVAGGNEESRFQIAQGVAGALGMQPSDLSAQARERFESPLGGRVVYPQTYENYEVYQGGVTLVSRPQDSAVFVVNTSLKDLSQVSLSQNVSGAEAVQIAKTFLKNPSAQMMGNVPERPVIWAEDPAHAQLAYVLAFSVEKPEHDEIRVIVGLSEQKVLYSRSVLKH